MLDAGGNGEGSRKIEVSGGKESKQATWRRFVCSKLPKAVA